jgi:type IV fimbrial biogenesis protein FimT
MEIKNKEQGKMSGNKKGFSLTELMIVIAIIGIIGMVSAPNIVTGLPKYRIKSAARDIASKLRRARSTAVKKHRDVTLFFDTANNRYSVDGIWFPDQDQNLSGHYGSGVSFGGGKATKNATVSGVSIPTDAVSFSGNRVTFNSRGISIGGFGTGYVYLTNNRGDAYAVGVRNFAGAIVVRHWIGSDWE